jgi:hypothetical protein
MVQKLMDREPPTKGALLQNGVADASESCRLAALQAATASSTAYLHVSVSRLLYMSFVSTAVIEQRGNGTTHDTGSDPSAVSLVTTQCFARYRFKA